jgi:hypothetical protein
MKGQAPSLGPDPTSPCHNLPFGKLPYARENCRWKHGLTSKRNGSASYQQIGRNEGFASAQLSDEANFTNWERAS